MGGAIACGLLKGEMFKAVDIACTTRTEESLAKVGEMTGGGCMLTCNNAEAAKWADIIVLAVKPWRIEEVIDEIRPALDFDKHIIVSVAAGVSFDQLNAALTKDMDGDRMPSPVIFRVMPNTAIAVRSSMTFVSARNASGEQTQLMLDIFSEMGNAMLIEERLMQAGTALASSGIAYAMRYMRASIEGGVELGFYPREAREIVLHTVKGAVELLLESGNNPETEIDKVTTPGGITIRGLNEMELSGFTPSVIRGLKASK